MKKIIIPLFIFFITFIGFLAFTQTSYGAACDSGGSWSDCKPDKTNAAIGAACGPNSGSQKITRTAGSKNCTPHPVTRNCQPTAAQACNSNICLDNKCVQCTDANTHLCSGNQHCGTDNKCADNKPCDSGGSWSDCKPDNPNAAIGAACGPNSGSQKITRTAGSKNCSPHPVTRNCQPPEAAACNSNLCGDNNKCIKCKNDNQCGDNQKCENNACIQKPPVCDKNPPSIDVNPNNRNGDPGEEKVYNIKVTNNDTGKDCDPVTFVLSKEHLPTDKWTGQFDDNTLSISKNDSKSTKFKVKSPKSANGGPKTIIVGLRRQAQQEAQVKVNSTYTVVEPPTPTPTKKPDPAPANEGSPLVMGIAIQEGHASRDGREAKTLAAIDNFARSVGQYPGTFSIWNNFETDGWEFGPRGTFPNTTLLNGLYKRHITPVIFMQPVGPNTSNAAIAAGAWDTYLRTWATAAKNHNKPIILRYAHEMNGNWFPWSAGKQGNTPTNYITAWQHIYNVVKPIAPNVKFFWCPMQGQDAMSKYFPGKDFVDYIGFDSYERASNDRSMADLYRPSIAELRALPIPKNSDGSSKIPMIIGETGILINFSNRNKWLSDGYPAVNSQYPDVAAIIYFNFDMNNLFGVAAEPGVNWLLSAGTDMRPAYANLAGKPKFRGAFSPFSSTATPPSGDPDPTENPNPTTNPTPTNVPNPTDEPEPTDTPNPTDGPNPTQEPTPTPTPTPIPTPTPTFPPGSTILSITVGIDGIGTTARIPIGGNVDPKRKTRDLDVRLYKVEDNTLAYSKTQTFTYNSSIGKFQATFDISDFPGTGTYNIYLQGKPYLTGRLPGSATIVSQQTTSIDSASFNLTTGNINSIDQSENKVDLMDYQVLLSCSIYGKEKETCNRNPDYATYSDLNDDGRVDEDDYTLFLKEFGNEGAILP